MLGFTLEDPAVRTNLSEIEMMDHTPRRNPGWNFFQGHPFGRHLLLGPIIWIDLWNETKKHGLLKKRMKSGNGNSLLQHAGTTDLGFFMASHICSLQGKHLACLDSWTPTPTEPQRVTNDVCIPVDTYLEVHVLSMLWIGKCLSGLALRHNMCLNNEDAIKHKWYNSKPPFNSAEQCYFNPVGW